MALSTNSEIKATILEDWEQFENSQYPEDLLREFVDSELPIYYGDIVSEWNELPMEDSNRFWEIRSTVDKDTTIYTLMLEDLYLYYCDQFDLMFEEIKEEKAGE
jgi:hypothetical protein